MANFDGRPGNFPITAYYKGDFSLQFTFTSGGSPYSLAGATAAFIVSEKNGTAALSLSSGSGLTISGGAGTILLSITNAQIVALATQEYDYEMIITLSGGTVWPVVDGAFIVSESGQSNYSGDTVDVALDGNSITMTILPSAPSFARVGGVLVSSPTGSSISTGNSKAVIRIPSDFNGMNLTAVAASCSTAGGSGTTSVQLRRVRGGVSADMLSTPITIDANETDSSTAATAAVIDTTNDDISTADQIHIDLDSISSGALGIYISFTFQPA